VLTDDARGLRDTDIVYIDTNPEQIESLADTAPHRPVDLEIVSADKEGQSTSDLYSIYVSLTSSLHAGQAMYVHTLSCPQPSMESQLGNFVTSVFLTLTQFKFPSQSRPAWTEVRVG